MQPTPAAAMATVATAAIRATPTQLTWQLHMLALVLVLALALLSVLAMNASTLSSAAKEWATPNLHATTTWACILNLAAALLVRRKPTPAAGAMVACYDILQHNIIWYVLIKGSGPYSRLCTGLF